MTIKIPKIELHVHLEGTIRPELAKILAKRNQLHLPNSFLTYKNTYPFKNFEDFLNTYDVIASLIKKPEDYFDITYSYLKQSADEGALYTEMSFSPMHAERSSNMPSKEHLIAIIAAIDKAHIDFGIIGRIIIIGVRHFGANACERIAKKTHHFSHPYIVGFGLGGNELLYPATLFKNTFAIARDAGLKGTIHAGEFGSPESIIEAIKSCQVYRIGHGVQAINCQKTLDFIKAQNIALEICPSSNVRLGLYTSLKEHPLPRFLAHEINVSLNSDDPPFMETSIGEEYTLAHEVMNISKKELMKITMQSIDASFANDEIKTCLRKRISDLG